MDPVVHFEIPTDDLARAQRFYRESFGWSLASPPGMAYVFATTTPVDPVSMRPTNPGGINGGMLVRQGPVQAPVVTVQVGDVRQALERIVKAGGRAVGEPRDVGPGLAAYFEDSEGNVVGLFAPKAAPAAAKPKGQAAQEPAAQQASGRGKAAAARKP